jgi:kynurenine formamidase
MIPILQRGILVDVAGYKRVDVLPNAYEITVEDLQATLESEGVKITPDTAVIFRTGYYKHFCEGNPAYMDAIAGPGLPVAQCLVEAGVNLIGADNMTVEALPPRSSCTPLSTSAQWYYIGGKYSLNYLLRKT